MEAAAQGLHFVPELAARKYSPEQYAAAYGQAEGGRIGAANGGIQGLMPRRGYSHGGSHWYNPLSWLGGEDETQDVNLYGEPETITYNDKTYVMPSQVYPTRGEHQLEGTALEAYIEKNEAMKKFYRENKNMMPKTWISKAQGGRIGYAEGNPKYIRKEDIPEGMELKPTMTADWRDHNFDGIEDREQGIYLPRDFQPIDTSPKIKPVPMPKLGREDFGAFGGVKPVPMPTITHDPKESPTYNEEHTFTWDDYFKNKAQGGRIGAQEGGLMDMGGMEKDYRQEGGFVPIGGQEKADDVPARLSKNEFVFTADAVRAAGGGDIDAGAEIMENVMDNLEAGGKVSEESQGLEGAQEMFANAQQLQNRII